MKQKYFTLVELLVVIAIMGILSSMLLPALQNAREKGMNAVCINNQKQMGLLMLQMHEDKSGYDFGYAKENMFPFYYMWFRHMEIDYLGDSNTNVYTATENKLFFCPTSKTADGTYQKLSYGYNYYLWSMAYYSGSNQKNLDGYDSPSSLVMFGDSGENGFIDSLLLLNPSYYLGDRHSGKANIAFVDGHVEASKSNVYDYYTKPYLYEY